MTSDTVGGVCYPVNRIFLMCNETVVFIMWQNCLFCFCLVANNWTSGKQTIFSSSGLHTHAYTNTVKLIYVLSCQLIISHSLFCTVLFCLQILQIFLASFSNLF